MINVPWTRGGTTPATSRPPRANFNHLGGGRKEGVMDFAATDAPALFR